jgi:hypothetical protein
VLLHPRSRSLMSSAQYLQLTTARACEVPACLSHATQVLLTLLAVSPDGAHTAGTWGNTGHPKSASNFLHARSLMLQHQPWGGGVVPTLCLLLAPVKQVLQKQQDLVCRKNAGRVRHVSMPCCQG